MFNRIFKGEPSPASPAVKSTHREDNNPQPQWTSAGLLPPFFMSRSSNGSEVAGGLSATAAELPTTPIAQDQQQQRSFFGGLLSQASPNVEPPSPGTIRMAASALLKKSIASPPLLSSANGDDGDPHRARGTDRDDDGDGDGGGESFDRRIHRLDERIADLKSEIRRSQSQLARCARDDHALRRGLLESTHRHSVAIKLWRRTNDGLKARVECFESETTPGAAREIANLIRDAAPPNKDSAYLMMLQDQLNKATAKLEHLGSQTEIVLHKGEEVVESLREEMNEVIRERCRMELELLDQERMLEDDMRKMVVRTERRLRRVQGEIDYLEANAVKVLKKQEEEEEEEKEDEKEEEDKGRGKDDGRTADGECKNKEGVCEADISDDGGNERDRTNVDDTNDEGEMDGTATAEDDGKDGVEAQHTPDNLRKELRMLAMERDQTLSVLQKKLREKNEEFHDLMRLRESRQKSISKLEAEKRDREEWARSKRGDVDETFLST
ncbi:hypothetical protein ACHAW5_004697 [Stephanodiscus triporus]|uniref:Uncharacterized protein n=1 Tax=Stephanodiscus triporus TaxID=2934178 RepID=A0ABD3P2D5_9STRA